MGFGRDRHAGLIPLGQQGGKRAIRLSQITARHLLHFFRSNFFNSIQIALRKSQVVSHYPVRAQILSLAIHRFSRTERRGNKDFFGFFDFLRSKTAGSSQFDFLEDGPPSFLATIAVGNSADTEQAGITRTIGPSIDRMSQSLFVADLPIEPGTVTLAHDRAQHVQRRNILVPNIRDVPSVMKMTQLDRRLIDTLPRRRLARFLGQNFRRQRARRNVVPQFGNLGQQFGSVQIAHDDVEHVFRSILLPVISIDVVPANPVENLAITDNRISARTNPIGRFEQPAAGRSPRIVFAHIHLPANHVALLFQFLGGQQGVAHDVAEDIGNLPPSFPGRTDPVNGAVKGGVGIHVTSQILNFPVDGADFPGLGSLEEHVLQNVGKAGTQPFAFVDASGAAPSLCRNDRSAPVLSDDHRQSVRQTQQLSLGSNRKRSALPAGCHSAAKLSRRPRHALAVDLATATFASRLAPFGRIRLRSVFHTRPLARRKIGMNQRFPEIEHPGEILATILIGLREQFGLNQFENDLSQIFATVDPPLGEHEKAQRPELLQHVLPHAFREFPSRYVPGRFPLPVAGQLFLGVG